MSPIDYIAAFVSVAGACGSLVGVILTYRGKRREVDVEEDKNVVVGFDALCNRLTAEIARLEKKIADNEKQIKDMEEEMRVMRKENAQLREQIRRYEQENAELRAAVKMLREQLAHQGEWS